MFESVFMLEFYLMCTVQEDLKAEEEATLRSILEENIDVMYVRLV